MSVRHFFILACSAILFAGWTLPVDADPVGDLYAAEVRVHDQTRDTRASALKDAISQVLVKVTGSQAVLETSEAATLLENPSRYLQQFSYETVQPPPADPEAASLLLRAEFDGNALEQRLRAAGLPLWGRERPLTLAWVAYSDNAERRITGRDAADPLVEALQRSARRRGLPLVLPAMDAEDATRVTFMDVWGLYEDPLLMAAERYAPDAVLAGSVFKAGNELWAGRWTLLRDGQRRERWETRGASPQAVAVDAVDALAEYYGREFAVLAATGGDSLAVVEVTDVGGLKEYAKVQSYLAGLSIVQHAGLLQVDDNVLRFELALTGTVRALEQSIALGRVLEPLPSDTEPEEVSVRLGPTLDPGAVTGMDDGGISPAAPAIPQLPELRYRLRR